MVGTLLVLFGDLCYQQILQLGYNQTKEYNKITLVSPGCSVCVSLIPKRRASLLHSQTHRPIIQSFSPSSRHVHSSSIVVYQETSFLEVAVNGHVLLVNSFRNRLSMNSRLRHSHNPSIAHPRGRQADIGS